jgi:hypothetical protein
MTTNVHETNPIQTVEVPADRLESLATVATGPVASLELIP